MNQPNGAGVWNRIVAVSVVVLLAGACHGAAAAPGLTQDSRSAATQRTAAAAPGRAGEGGDDEASRIARAVELLGESPVAAVLNYLPAEARRFNEHMTTLANPFFEGRQPGTAGNRYAADYLEHYFRKFGLEPVFESEIEALDGTLVLEPRSSYRQTFSSGRDVRVAEQRLTLVLPGGRRELSAGKDFVVLGQSGDGRVSAPIVFVGYGIVDGPEGHSDFPADADLTGKIAMVFRFEPMDEEGRSRFAERGWSPAAQLEAKIAAVAERNAAGVILVNPPGASDPRANQMIDSRASLMGRAVGRGVSTPVAMMSTAAAEQVFQAAFPDGDVTLMSARKQADEGGFAFEMPDVRLELRAKIAREPVLTDNVAAILPGRGELAGEYIVIGAHYDHVGYGPAGVMNPANVGTLHPGADDNASGTSGMLILAEKLSEAYGQLSDEASVRSVLFIGFTAEELGLLGSRHFVEHPPLGFKLDDIYMMINLDMIGRLREAARLTVEGVDSAKGFLEWLQPYFDSSGLPIAHGGRMSGNSDHASFYRKNIPVLFFFTGLHREYHTPADISSTVNQAGAAGVINLAYDIAMALAKRAEPLEFTGRRQGGRAALADIPAAVAEERQALPAARTGGVRFGIAPGNYNDDEPGITVADVYEDTSAAVAGIKIGDRMIRWNDTPLTSVESWMPLLSGHKPGDVVKVTVMRDGKEMTFDVKLQGRGGNN
jgi:Zn-dependent M28 family amino/carboxypeptidase